MSTDVKEAMDTIRQAMIDDGGGVRGSYAHSWHCNIAMMCFDAIQEEFCDVLQEDAHIVANDAASRFMKLCFNIETKC